MRRIAITLTMLVTSTAAAQCIWFPESSDCHSPHGACVFFNTQRELIWSCSAAYSAGFWWCGPLAGQCGDSEHDCGPGGTLVTLGPTCAHDNPYHGLDTFVEVTSQSMMAFAAPCCHGQGCPGPVPCPAGLGFGWTAAGARFDGGGAGAATAALDTLQHVAEFPAVAAPGGYPLQNATLTRLVSLLLLNDDALSVHYVTQVGSLHVDSGLSFDRDRGVWSGARTLTFPSNVAEVRTLTLRFDDARMDADKDGRFTLSDVAGLEQYFGEATPEGSDAWDFNSDRKIDDRDRQIFIALIEAGLDAGLLGDFNGDGRVNCGDRSDYSRHIGARLGEADYRAALDQDLDGDISADDVAWAQREVIPGDANGNWVIDRDDINLVLSTLGARAGDPRYHILIDADEDGIIDSGDLDIVRLNYGRRCSAPRDETKP